MQPLAAHDLVEIERDALAVTHRVHDHQRLARSQLNDVARGEEHRVADSAVPIDLDGAARVLEFLRQPLQRRVLPDGDYQVVLNVAGGVDRQQVPVPLTIRGADTQIPEITDLSLVPDRISPNYDARDDVTHMAYRLSKDAGVAPFLDGANARVWMGQEVQLTARHKGTESEVPMCGVPHHALEGYLAKLLAAGLKVAICDQVEDPALAKGLVKREVTRVVTPGTLTDDALLDPRDIRRDRLRMPAEAGYPVVHVVHGNEQHVGTPPGGERAQGSRAEKGAASQRISHFKIIAVSRRR